MLRSYDPKWNKKYCSPPNNITTEFYIPALCRSTRYDRVVAYWNSRHLANLASTLEEFVLNGGKMRLMIAPAQLLEEDLNAIKSGEDQIEFFQKHLLPELKKEIPDDVLKDRLGLLTWMVANEVLEIKIGFCRRDSKLTLIHDKVGIFYDADENFLSFSGSNNETSNAMYNNSESFNVFRSWDNEFELDYAKEDVKRFEQIWESKKQEYLTWNATDWLKDEMGDQWQQREPSEDYIIDVPDIVVIPPTPAKPGIPSDISLRDYQVEAIDNWEKNEGRGIYAMATGTGKTITALATIVRAHEQNIESQKPLLVLIIVPQIELVEQWYKDAVKFGFSPVKSHSKTSTREKKNLKSALSAARSSWGKNTEIVITTAASLTPNPKMEKDEHFLQRQLTMRGNAPLFVVGDEVHSIGTHARLSALPKTPKYTLGLSATPKRHRDDEGSEALLEYFGDPVLSISIKEAIYTYDALVPYDYHVHRVDLSDEELINYKNFSFMIAQAYANQDDEKADQYIRLRTRLTQHAAGKLDVLRSVMRGGLSSKLHQLIYLAEGKSSDEEEKQMQLVEQILTQEFSMEVRCYFGETTISDRLLYQQQLIDGEINALLAMKCLDEGIDIPAAKIGIIMASSQNPRQFVQRRGRLLRKDPDNPKTHAIIHDFLVLPPSDVSVNSDSEKRLIGNELSRAAELAEACRNSEAMSKVIRIALDHGLDPEEYSWIQNGLLD